MVKKIALPLTILSLLVACSGKTPTLINRSRGGSLQACNGLTAHVTPIAPDLDKVYLNQPVAWRAEVAGCEGPFSLNLSDGTRMDFEGSTYSFTTSYRQAGRVTETFSIAPRNVPRVTGNQVSVSSTLQVKSPVTGDLTCAVLNDLEIPVQLDGMGRLLQSPIVPFEVFSTAPSRVLSVETLSGPTLGVMAQTFFPTTRAPSQQVSLRFNQTGGYVLRFLVEDDASPVRTGVCLARVNLRGVDPVRPSCSFQIPQGTNFKAGSATKVEIALSGPVARLDLNGAGINPIQMSGPFTNVQSLSVIPLTTGPRLLSAVVTSSEGLSGSCVAEIAPKMTCQINPRRIQIPDLNNTLDKVTCSGAQTLDLPLESTDIQLTFSSVINGVDDLSPAVKVNGSPVPYSTLYDSTVRLRAGRNTLQGSVYSTPGPNCRLSFNVSGSYEAYECNSFKLTTTCESGVTSVSCFTP